MAQVTVHVERTVDNRDLTERIRQLEAQNSALRVRLKELEGRGAVVWRDYIVWKDARA